MPVLLAAMVILSTPSANALTKAECVKASDLGQDLRDQGRLQAARERFLTCGLGTCPAVVRAQCQEWLADVDRRLPTVLLRVRDDAGLDVVDAQVSIDGVTASQGVDGRSFPLDPGAHVFRFEAAGREVAELKAVIRERDKDRLLDVTMHQAAPSLVEAPAPAPTPSAPRASATIPVLTAVSGSVAVVGGVLFVYFGSDAKSRVDHLRATCAPDCAPADVAAARHQAEIANVSLVVGAVAAAGAIALLVWRPPWRMPTVGVGPSAGGAMGWVSGSF